MSPGRSWDRGALPDLADRPPCEERLEEAGGVGMPSGNRRPRDMAALSANRRVVLPWEGGGEPRSAAHSVKRAADARMTSVLRPMRRPALRSVPSAFRKLRLHRMPVAWVNWSAVKPPA